MDLYDTVYIDYPLPIPSDLPAVIRSYIAYEMFAGSFKTDDMYQALRNYEVDQGGQIFEVDHFHFESNGQPEKYKMDITKKLTIYTYVYPREFDSYEEVPERFRLEYDLYFEDGILIAADFIKPIGDFKNEFELHRSI